MNISKMVLTTKKSTSQNIESKYSYMCVKVANIFEDNDTNKGIVSYVC
jgi:hypothetical protein